MPLVFTQRAGQSFVLKDRETCEILAKIDTTRDDIGRIKYRVEAPQTVQINRLDRK